MLRSLLLHFSVMADHLLPDRGPEFMTACTPVVTLSGSSEIGVDGRDSGSNPARKAAIKSCVIASMTSEGPAAAFSDEWDADLHLVSGRQADSEVAL
jgi:hypothetical protein